jgi:hypothetical protein
MANNWNIPGWLEKEVRERDKTCVYCGVGFTPAKVSTRTAASWEHIINNSKIITKRKYCPLLLRLQRQQGAETAISLAYV